VVKSHAALVAAWAAVCDVIESGGSREAVEAAEQRFQEAEHALEVAQGQAAVRGGAVTVQ
jgi:hypothetical protein